jgi:hypothetical protein
MTAKITHDLQRNKKVEYDRNYFNIAARIVGEIVLPLSYTEDWYYAKSTIAKKDLDEKPTTEYRVRTYVRVFGKRILINYCYTKLNLTMKQIGEIFGLDHSTITHSLQKSEDDNIYPHIVRFKKIIEDIINKETDEYNERNKSEDN